MPTTVAPRLTIVAATIFCVQSCGGGSDSSTQPNGTNSTGIALTLFPSTATARQAELTVVVATALRTGGYSGAITFTVEGAPTGMAVVVTTPSTISASTAATISFTPALSVAAGTYNLIIRAKGSGVSDATAALAFTVTGAQAQFSLVPLTRTLSIPAGGRDSTLVLEARNPGFTGPVTVSLLNAGSGELLLARGREPRARTGSKLAAICSELTAGARRALRDACDGENQQSFTATKKEREATMAPRSSSLSRLVQFEHHPEV